MIISYWSEERHLQGMQTALQAARYPCRLPSDSKEATLASLRQARCSRNSSPLDRLSFRG
jgi:hypothetical protein